MSETPLKSETATKIMGPQNNEGTCCETPNFAMPKVKMLAVYREFAGKGVEQTKQTYEKLKAAVDETAALLEKAYATTADIAGEYRAKVIEATHANIGAAFDFASKLAGAKSASEMVEQSTAHARMQFNAVSIQNKEIWGLAQELAVETARPAAISIARVLEKTRQS